MVDLFSFGSKHPKPSFHKNATPASSSWISRIANVKSVALLVLAISIISGTIYIGKDRISSLGSVGGYGNEDENWNSNRKRADVQALAREAQHLLPPVSAELPQLSTYFPQNHVSDLLWGSYRPQVYVGMRTRSPEDALLCGFMWYEPTSNPLRVQLRHVTKSDDEVKFQWIKHDGRTFGIQQINDTKLGLEMTSSFIKYSQGDHGGDWVMKVNGQPSSKSSLEQLSLLFYAGLENQVEGKIKMEGTSSMNHNPLMGTTQIVGSTPQTKQFSMVIPDQVKKNKKGTYYSGVRMNEVWQVEKTLRIVVPKGARRAQLENIVHTDANLFVVQRFQKVPFEMQLVFLSNTKSRFESAAAQNTYVQSLLDRYDEDLNTRIAEFDSKFDDTFQLDNRVYSPELIEMGQVSLSNLLGGIGYFHGHNRILIPHKQQKQERDGFPLSEPNWGYTGRRYELTTATPSRAYFPRGFLWDEGFHQLIISQFDKELSKDILFHWLHLIHDDGWLPREQILGSEAESRVPEKFIPQVTDNANPPTFFFPIESIINRGSLTESDRAFLERAFSQLANNFFWYLKTQVGPMKNTFRWRGAQGIHTLASGLDDYPRALNRSTLEEHMDLHSWLINSANNLDRMAVLLEKFDIPQFNAIEEELIATLHERFWNPHMNAYCDYDGFSDKHVEHIGYVNLFPLLFGLIQIDSPRLADTLALIENDTLLKSPFGIRSLAKSDPLFGTEENYWRGPIWVNMNYLTLRALHRYYISVEGPYQARAKQVYNNLRRALVNNIFRIYKKQGSMFENYNSLNGNGQGQHPFAGWTSLVLLIMAEIY